MKTKQIQARAEQFQFSYITGIPRGRNGAARWNGAEVRIYLAQDVIDQAGYIVRCAWKVREAHSDNAESFSAGYQPFGHGMPFVGLDIHCQDATEAHRVANICAEACRTNSQPELHQTFPAAARIGNVRQWAQANGKPYNVNPSGQAGVAWAL